ncbi:MAG: HAD hydrolase family protein [Candidatus Omnitrophica bacterium]|nr:HAD hydrolase family protein [Candidatus Omnitrophota bacterium]
MLLFADDELNIHIVSGGKATKEHIEQIMELFPSRFHMLCDSGRFKVSERITDKGQRLEEILKETNLPETSIIAIGDDEETDRSMALREGYFVRVYPHTRSISPNALDVLVRILEAKSEKYYIIIHEPRRFL